jgi:hypothetical protein
MKVELDVKIPEGFEATGEHRHPRSGEYYISFNGNPGCAKADFCQDVCIILRKKKRKVIVFVPDVNGEYSEVMQYGKRGMAVAFAHIDDWPCGRYRREEREEAQ